jgi:hypothetical protein
MSNIVISYRRNDTKWITGRIFEHLENHFGTDHVFMDVDHIHPGEDFSEHIKQVLDRCDVLIAIVGAEWQEPDESGKGRLFNENDWVRLELSTALSRKIPVVPVLIDGTKMPKGSELPADLADFVFRQAITFDTENFKSQMLRLIRSLDRLVAKQEKSPPPPAGQTEHSRASKGPSASPSHQSSSAEHQKASSPAGNIYISYSRDDDLPPPDRPDRKGFVTFLDEAIRYEFRDLGPDQPRVWRDMKTLSLGDQFTSKAEEALRETSCLVVILSPNWLASPWCRREVETFARIHGDGFRERIIVVHKRYTDPNKHRLMFQGLLGFSFFSRSTDPDDIAGDLEYFDRGEVRDQRYWHQLKALVASLLRLSRPSP